MTTRTEHLTWCKERALEYVDTGRLDDALSSFMSDLRKHDDTADELAGFGPVFATEGISAVLANDKAKVRRLIEGVG